MWINVLNVNDVNTLQWSRLENDTWACNLQHLRMYDNLFCSQKLTRIDIR